MNRGLLFLSGVVVGSAVTYVMDPMEGRRRRKLARDMLIRRTHSAQDTAEAAQRDMVNRARGWRARMRTRMRDEPVDDDVLVERVRSRLGRVASHPGSIHVTARDAWVTLTGDVLAGEGDQICREVGRVRGVGQLESQLREHRDASAIPGLQGVSRRRGRRPELAGTYWGPGPRVMVGALGAVLAGRGASRRGLAGIALVMAGTGLMARAITNMELSRLVGLRRGRRGVDFHKTVHVNAPVEEVYNFWSHIENFPRFMEHVREVHPMQQGRSHWRVAGPGGAPIAFDAEITSREPNRLLAWRSIGRSPFRHAGVVQFEEAPPGGTRVDIRMTYKPPLGAAGHVIASLLGADPKHALDEDLVRFKSLIEEGKTSAHGHEVTREELASSIAGSEGRGEHW